MDYKGNKGHRGRRRPKLPWKNNILSRIATDGIILFMTTVSPIYGRSAGKVSKNGLSNFVFFSP